MKKRLAKSASNEQTDAQVTENEQDVETENKE